MAALSAALPLAGCSKPRFHGIDLSDSSWGKGLRLKDPSGRERTLAEFKGRLVLLFFGYTQCPDICPTALSRAVEVLQLLGGQAPKLQVIFITVDPERDTPALLAAYTQAFHPDFLGLYGDAAETAATAEEFKVFYRRVPTGSSYTMDHTAQSFVFDARGQLRLGIRHSDSARHVADDLSTLLKE